MKHSRYIVFDLLTICLHYLYHVEGCHMSDITFYGILTLNGKYQGKYEGKTPLSYESNPLIFVCLFCFRKDVIISLPKSISKGFFFNGMKDQEKIVLCLVPDNWLTIYKQPNASFPTTNTKKLVQTSTQLYLDAQVSLFAITREIWGDFWLVFDYVSTTEIAFSDSSSNLVWIPELNETGPEKQWKSMHKT